MTAETKPDTGEKAPLRLWLRLLDCTGLIEREVRWLRREYYQVTLPQFDLMAALDREQGFGEKGLAMGRLSEKLRVSNGNVTGVVNRLVRDGMIRRWVPEDDRRTVLIALTEKGRASFAEMAHVHRGWINEMLAEIAPADRDRLYALLDGVWRSVLNERQRHVVPGHQTSGQMPAGQQEKTKA